jgi:hypothetical protein
MRSGGIRICAVTWALLAGTGAAQAQLPTFTQIQTFTPIKSFTPIQSFTPVLTFTPVKSFTPIPTSTAPGRTPSRSRTPTFTPSAQATASGSPGQTGTPTASGTRTRTLTPSRRPTDVPTAIVCVGDCNVDNAVSINELIIGVLIASQGGGTGGCVAFDPNGSGSITIEELVRAVGLALSGC